MKHKRPTTMLVLCMSVVLLDRAYSVDIQPWAGAAVTDWENAGEAVFVSEMGSATPANALSPMILKKRCWKVIPYEMTNGMSGSMVFASPEAGAPELAIPLKVEKPGSYAIFVGLFSTSEIPTEAWLRLGGEAAPVRRSSGAERTYGISEEVFFKVADLDTKSSLGISQLANGMVKACGVTHVRLIPLTQNEVDRRTEDHQDASTRQLIATFDGFSDFYYRSPRTVTSLRSNVEIFRDTDFGTLILQSPGGDKVNYPSKIGHMKGSQSDDYPRVGDRHFVESIQELAAKKVNPMQVMIDGAHEVGMEVHVGIRPAGWSFFEPYADYWESPFYQNHPEWRCETKDGKPITRMSWAVPQVRSHLIELLREQIRMGADGAHVAFNRGYPVSLFEPAARALFEEKFHLDPRFLEDSDDRVLQWRSDIVASFLRELRNMLNEEQAARELGKHLKLSIMILGTDDDDLRFGVDVQRLVNERLVDEVSTELGFGRTSNTYNLELLRGSCSSKGVPYFPGMSMSPKWYADIPKYYNNGAAGVAIWDAHVGDIYEWACVSRFGHIGETKYRLKHLDLNNPPRTFLQFRKLGDQHRDSRFGPFWGG